VISGTSRLNEGFNINALSKMMEDTQGGKTEEATTIYYDLFTFLGC